MHLTTTESTNKYASELLAKGEVAEGMVVTTDYQSMGRGQIGRSWYGSSGLNVMCSLVLKPKFLQPRQQFQLSIAVSCALRRSIAGLSPNKEVAIKWPNDIYVGSRKVAGILIQNSIAGSTITNTIVGMGVNVNEQIFPPDLPNPTSLSLLQGGDLDLPRVYAAIFRDIEYYYLKLRNGHSTHLLAEYHTHLYSRGQVTAFAMADGTEVQGIIEHVDEQGKLVVLMDGVQRSFAFREVRLLAAE